MQVTLVLFDFNEFIVIPIKNQISLLTSFMYMNNATTSSSDETHHSIACKQTYF